MTHENIIPAKDELKMKWLSKFSVGLSLHGTELGIAADEIKATKADSDFFTGLLSYLETVSTNMNSLVLYKNTLLTGDSIVLTDVPSFSIMPTHVAVLPGIFNRARTMVTTLKANPKLTAGMIQDMGLEGSEIIYDFDKIVVNAKIVMKNSHTYSYWNHKGTDAVDIKCDYGDTLGMVNVARISSVHFLDPRLPAAGVETLYKYMYRYVVKDEQVGEWSNVISIAVKGI